MSRRVSSSCIKSRCTPDLGTGQTVRAFVGRTRTSAHTLPSPRPPIPIRNLTLLPGGRNPVVSTNTGQMKSRTHRFPRGPPRGTRAKGYSGQGPRLPLLLRATATRCAPPFGDLSQRTFPHGEARVLSRRRPLEEDISSGQDRAVPSPHRSRSRLVDRHNERVDAPAD